jgi:hypothetical protein
MDLPLNRITLWAVADDLKYPTIGTGVGRDPAPRIKQNPMPLSPNEPRYDTYYVRPFGSRPHGRRVDPRANDAEPLAQYIRREANQIPPHDFGDRKHGIKQKRTERSHHGLIPPKLRDVHCQDLARSYSRDERGYARGNAQQKVVRIDCYRARTSERSRQRSGVEQEGPAK